MEVEHKGSRITSTFFRNEKKEVIKVTVWFTEDWIQAGIYFKYQISTKGFKCRNFIYQITSKTSLDDRFLEFINKQQLYEAYNNHWIKLNPFRLFHSFNNNGNLENGSVIEIKSETFLKEY